MERIISFIHEGLGQVFVYSGIQRMMELHNGKNYFNMTEARTPMNTTDVRKYTGGKTPTGVPLMDVEYSQLLDQNTMVAKGKQEIDGVLYSIEITKDEMIFTPINALAEVPTEEEVAEEHIEEVAVEEPVEVEVEVEEEPVEEPVAKEAESQDIEETVTEVSTEETSEPVVEEAVTEVSTEETVEEVVEAPIVETVEETFAEPVEMEQDSEPVNDFMNMPAETNNSFTRVGMYFGNRTGVPSNITIGTRHAVHGLEFNGIMSNPNSSEDYRNRRLRRAFGAEHNYNQEPTSIFTRTVTKTSPAPRPTFTKEVKPVEEPSEDELLMQKWKDKHPVDAKATPEEVKVEIPATPIDRLEESIVESSTEEVVDETVSKQKRKEAVRAKLSKEINDVIGDIPVDCLGPIMEFTSHEVDTHKLDEQGDMFCIDNRWHKQGNWYCIDVVCNASRHFYNAKRGVSLEIPINVCKEWLCAIK